MPPVRPYPKKNMDRLTDALQAITEIEKSLSVLDDTKLNNDARNAIRRLKRALAEAKDASADGIESLAGGTLVRSRPSVNPAFSDRRA